MRREDAHIQYTDLAVDRFHKVTIGAKVVLGAIDWDSANQEGVKDLKRILAPQRTHWYIQTEPDTMHEGPWSTDVYVFGRGRSDRPLHIHVDGHASGGVRPKWISDNLLFIRVWWGRLGATDYILDIEQQKWLYAMDADFSEIQDQCE
jgi:hypothetical protein